ncbi:MAG: putative F420-dependent oxidoreductase [Candidatus Poriferisodalaceae bacterium]|jgi:probable F420-dependent oxidoreductase
MKLAVEFPSVAYREGKDKVLQLAKAIEDIGYDELAVFDHVVMGFPGEGRTTMYPARMPILEAFMTLALVTAVTDRVSLSTEVLVLPQRQPVLVAKQVSTLDTLSNGRVRLGVGVGWQDSEYDALEEDFSTRGKRMDEAIDLLRCYWGDEEIEFISEHYSSTAMGMEPKPPQGANIPIWIGGGSKAALRRTALKGDGWMGSGANDETLIAGRATIRRLAEEAGRDPDSIGMQVMLAPPPVTDEDKRFYMDLDTITARAARVKEMGFDWTAVNATAVFQAGARSVDAIIDRLGEIHEAIRAETA